MNAPLQAAVIESPTPQRAVTVTTPADLITLAVERGASVDQLERLFALKVQYEKHEAEKAMNEAMAAFHAEPVVILKRKHVEFASQKGLVSYNHAELSDVTDAIAPALGKHGLSFRWDVKQEQQKVVVTCIVSHRLGHSFSVTMDGPLDDSGLKNRIQQAGSTVTYLQRYTLLAAIGKSTKGTDNDGGDGMSGAAQQAAATQQASEDEALIDAGREAAMNGSAALTKWWGSLTNKQRGRMNREFGMMRRAAAQADAEAGRG